MTLQQMTLSEKESFYAERSESSRRFIQNAIELALSFGDFQKEIDTCCSPGMILGKVIKRIRYLVRFEASALYLVDEATADLNSAACWPNRKRRMVADEMAFLIDNGFVAWALRERRGINVYSQDGSHQVLLHAMATYNRIRGLFVGIFPAGLKRLPDASLEVLSIVLRNAANALESLACYNLIGAEKRDLEKIVQQKTEKVISYQKQLMQAQKAESLAVLAGGIAHQFNNSLTALIGNIDLLEMIGNDQPEVTHYISRLRPIAQRMGGLTNQMLAYAQGGQYKQTVVPLNRLIRDVTSAIRRILKPMTRLVVALPTDDVLVNVDMTQIQMVLLAIVTNADESLEGEGQIRISAEKTTIGSHAPKLPADMDLADHVCIAIQDTGAGMPPEIVRRVFEPFFSTKSMGRGLGMAAAFGIVKNHSGAIEITSEIGGGSCVRVYLPLAKP